MLRISGALFFWPGCVVFLAFGACVIAMLLGSEMAAWMTGFFLLKGQVLFGVAAVSCLLGLELKLRSRKAPRTQSQTPSMRVFGVSLLALGCIVGVSSFFLLNVLPAYSVNSIRILAVVTLLLSVHLLRRSKFGAACA